VGGVGALVAEVAVDLEDPVDTADDAALEEQFRRDAQEEVHVEGVGVGDERASRGAAVQRLQHRGLDFEEISVAQEGAQLGHHLDAGAGDLPGLGADDEVDVALPDAGLLVEVLVRDGQRAQRLGGEAPVVGHHRKLTGARRDDLAVHEDDVAEVDVGLPAGQRFLADAVEADHDLQLGAVTFLQRGEAELALVAQEDHPAGDSGVDAGLGPRLEVGVLVADLREAVGTRNLDRVGLPTLRQDPLTLLPTDTKLLGQVVPGTIGVGRSRILGITHGSQLYRLDPFDEIKGPLGGNEGPLGGNEGPVGD